MMMPSPSCISRKLIAILATVVSCLYAPAQTSDCGTDVLHQLKHNADSVYRQQSDWAESTTFRYVKSHLSSASQAFSNQGCSADGGEKIYRIPVVVHVMHSPADNVVGTGSNLSDATIQAGIDHLNEAFRNTGTYAGGPYFTNASSFGAVSEDVKIEFVLAQRDPGGNASTGINRISTSYSDLFRDDAGPSGFSSEDDYLKSLSFWDSEQYVNVWLVNEICTASPNTGCGVAGYAYLAGAHGATYDGIVNEAQYWGASTNSSKVHIHEFGHYLNLYHTFNDPDGSSGPLTACENNDCLTSGDRVCDTPPDDGTTSVSCASSLTANSCSSDADDVSANNPFTSDVQDMYENYMDYGFQSCQNTYTQGQKLRMRAALTSIRSSLLESEGGIPVSGNDAGIVSVLAPGESIGCLTFQPVVSLRNFGTNSLNNAEITVALDGAIQHTVNWSGALTRDQVESVSLNPIMVSAGSHVITIYSKGVNGGAGADDYAQNDTIHTCFDAYAPSASLPMCMDFEGTTSAPNNWTLESSASGTGWQVYTGGTGCGTTQGSHAMYMDGWSNVVGSAGDDLNLWMESIDLSNYASASLRFDRAYKRSYSNRTLALEVEISTDCGATFTSLTSFSNSTLATVSGFEYAIPWEPTACSEWDSAVLNLSPYVGQVVMIRFQAQVNSYYSQNLYLDNLCLQGVVNTASCPDLVLSISGTDENCQQADGTATVNLGAGTAPFTYAWNTVPVQSGATATGLAAGSYEVIVADSNGCADTASIVLNNAGTPPTAGFNAGAANLDISFANTSIHSTSWFWDFGDGGSSTIENPSHTYSMPGNYSVCMVATGACGADTLCQSITVICPGPVAAYTSSVTNTSVAFTNASTQATSWFWDFGDGNHSASPNPSHQYGNPGTYTVCLVVSNACEVDSLCQQITVDCPEPNAAFSFVNNLLTIDFTNTSTLATSQIWDFGDGNTAFSSNPAHTYSAAGTYTVCQVVFNSCGVDTLCQQVTVSCTEPEAGFSSTAQNLQVDFSDASQSVDTWVWTFGDGGVSTGPNPSHIYTSAGTYTVCQMVFNSCSSDTLCQSVTVSCEVPTVAFAVTHDDLAASFTDLTSGADSWFWDFGDGNTATTASPQHNYQVGGIYAICLTATNECGSMTFCDTVTIEELCDLDLTILGQDPTCSLPNGIVSANVTGGRLPYAYAWNTGASTRSVTSVAAGTYSVQVVDSEGCEVGDSVVIVNTSEPPILEVEEMLQFCENGIIEASSPGNQLTWSDGSTGTSIPVTQTGSYWVSATNTAGCTSRDTVIVQIDTSPISAFAYQANGLEVNFFNASNTGGSYSWDFGDGNTASQFQPTHTYAQSGTYAVVHIVENACGSDTITNFVNVSITSIAPGTNGLFVAVYPNPSTGHFVAELNAVSGEEIAWELTDIRGRSVFELQEIAREELHQKAFDLSDQPEGIYTLRVQVGNSNFAQKITVSR